MTDTQKRIKTYKEALPGIKERLAAVALLLAISISMVASATFAWLTISKSPALTGVNMSVAANGNLEVALVTGNGKVVPGESKAGDSFAAEGQTVTGANITWGNLINLSDPSYGLENLVLRPAQLNTADLLKSPLYGALYGEDGRITKLSSNFGYAVWKEATDLVGAHFEASDEFGVRAISSMTVSAEGQAALFYNMQDDATAKNLAAVNAYKSLANNQGYMNSLATIMGLFMTSRMNSTHATLSNPTCSMEDLQNLRDMYREFMTAYQFEAQAMAASVNLQLFIKHGEGQYAPFAPEEFYPQTALATTTEVNTFISGISSKMSNNGVSVSRLSEFIQDYNTIHCDYLKMVDLCTSGTDLSWKDSGLQQITEHLVNVGTCTIDGTPINNIGASNAVGYLNGTHSALITNGVLYRFEERTGGNLEVKGMKITATINRAGITVPGTVTANISTSAPRNYNLFSNDLNTYAAKPDKFEGGTEVANDTYGLAVDLWVRTNAEGSYLTLEGNILSYTTEVTAMGKDPDGNEVTLYTVTFSSTDETTGEEVSYDVDVYKKETKDDQGNTVTKWYNAESHSELLLGEDVVPKEKKEILTTVTGFEGENRVWGDSTLVSMDATTQGSGSCYVYYADTPEDQARSLTLLEAFNVAFIDDKGNLLATGYMDTEHHYAANGRVTVPLVLSADSTNLGENMDGKTIYAITPLEKNVPMRITAIVYLDGTKLSNEEVLAAADIQGQLNIQFGSSMNLRPISNEELEGAERKVSASLDKTSFDYDTATEPMTTTVTVTITGEQPQKVTAFFIRSINATQGSREKGMTFQPAGDNTWTATFTFDSPGNYVLRHIRLDGADYDLDTPQTVEVRGFAVESLTCKEANMANHVSVMSNQNSSTVNLTLKFATNDEAKMPKKVQGRYLREDGTAVNVDFVYNSTTKLWTGKATFLTSGEYTMQYLVLDGEYVGLSESLHQTASVTLGMRVAVFTTSPHTFKYVPAEMADNMKLLSMQVKILDNAGNEMPGLSNVKLTYGVKGSPKTVDTDLTWNGTYYVGDLKTLEMCGEGEEGVGPGVWVFSSVSANGNTLTNATQYPTFTIQSPNPPEYVNHGTVSYQYAPNNDAKMTVDLAYTQAADVAAYIVKQGQTEGTWVTGIRGNETSVDGKPVNTWSFLIPKDANGYQDGHWQITQVKIWNAFDAEGSEYTEDAPLYFDVPNYNMKVVNRVYVTFAQGQSQDFGKDANGNVVGAFLQSYTISGLNVDIRDFEGKALQNVVIDTVDILLTQNGDSRSYGGYTSDSVNGVAYTIKFKKDPSDANGTRYIQDGTVTLQYAGSYTSALTVKSGVNSISVYQIANLPQYTVSSVTPSLVITGVTPSTSISTRITYTTKNLSWWQGGGTVPTFTATTPKTNSFTSYYAEVYAEMEADNSTQCHGLVKTKPQVKLKITGFGNADSATIEIPAGASDSAVSHQFTTDNQEILYQLGTTKQIKSWTSNVILTHYLQAYYGHETQTISEITLTKGSMTFTVYLENDVVIKNPSSVNQT